MNAGSGRWLAVPMALGKRSTECPPMFGKQQPIRVSSFSPMGTGPWFSVAGLHAKEHEQEPIALQSAWLAAHLPARPTLAP